MKPTLSVLFPLAEQRRPSALARKRWRDARAFEADIQTTLSGMRVPFVEWLLLETVCELVEEASDAISQSAIGARAGLTRQVVSSWMLVMSNLDLVDRGPASDGNSWRVLLTERGKRTLQECNERLEAAGLTG